ncbi:MAG: ParB N-terminal domain-containing protein, partial [Sphingomonas sp.]|nr:ParB N-terminal domain-containing protein [Sphingomonas sp.]
MITRHLSSTSLARQSNFAAVRLDVQYVATDQLKPRSRQVRRRTRQHDKRIARSIADFGFVVPIVVDEHLTIVAGEGRWEGAK